MARTSTYIALLRGINVGGKNKLPMAELRELIEHAGGSDVRTYIQSGNALFSASASVAKKLPSELAVAIGTRFGYDVPVVLRSEAELRAAAAGNPFLKPGVDVKTLHVAFLLDKPSAKAAAALDPLRSPGDTFALRGRDLYLHCPNGMARTKLTNAYLDRTLQTVSTARNWNTVCKLVALLD